MAKYLNMKLTKITRIIKMLRNCGFLKLLLFDCILFILFKHYEPQWEPNCEGVYTPKYLIPEQCMVICVGIVVNIIWCMVCIYKKRE